MSSTLTRPPGEAAPTRGPAPTASGRYPGLDGLRAIAIIAVLVFHANPAWLPGGFLGVDVFFVISGFLITSLLVRERARAGRIDFRAFWTRRARRLLPALAVVVVVSSLVARAGSSELVVSLPRQVLGAATFSTNWIEILSGGSYFDQTAPTLFMNFWSLAVEEQFYLVWPLATWALLAWAGRRVKVAIPVALAVASTVVMAVLYTPGQDNTRVYYGTDTHLMGLMTGAALAFAWASDLQSRLVGWVGGRRWSGPVALVTLAALMRLSSEDSPLTFYGGFALASLVTGVLLIATVSRADADGRPRQTAWQRVLDAPAASWVGERSYGLYLWHWPVILIVDEVWRTAPSTWPFAGRTVLIVLLTGLIAEASYRYVETPVRRFGFRETGRRVLAWARGLSAVRLRVVAALALVVALCFAATLVTAPTESATARILRENAAAEAGAGASGASGSTGAASTGGVSTAPVAALGTWGMPTGAEIEGFGDSIMVGCIPALNLYFPGVRLDAVSNRHLSDGIAAIKARADLRRAVVIDFGMNSGVKAEELGALLDLIGPDRMVVVVNLYGTFSRIDADNAAVAAAIAGRSNAVVADWYTTAKNNPASMQADRKHPSLRGSHLYAQTVQAAFAELSKRHTGQDVTLTTHPLPAH
jgi:peptidoglycan/LPS O-acetylase OafA/YrhL